jgi:uncharacterized protein GlcG (DUF336 family)
LARRYSLRCLTCWTALAASGAALLLPRPDLQAQSLDLTVADVGRVVGQAAAAAQRLGRPSWIAVTDREGNVQALFRMTGAGDTSIVDGRLGEGLEGRSLPASFVAVTKAGTGAFLSSGGNAFSTRTASFIVQDHFPPGVDLTPGGPLFGVQLSSLICTDVKSPPLPLGLAGDPGGIPLYKGGRLVGGLGVESDGSYGIDTNPADFDQPVEEQIAVAGAAGFEAPALIRADNILADGIRLPYLNVPDGAPGSQATPGTYLIGPQVGFPSAFQPVTLGGLQGEADRRFFPARAGRMLTAADVTQILTQAARQAGITRAAIRQPLGSDARVSIFVVDTNGDVLGAYRTLDAPVFGFDVAAQKARTAAFFSSPAAAATLRTANLSQYLVEQSLPLDGTVAFTTRAVGFLAQPFYPPGITGTLNGPFSTVGGRVDTPPQQVAWSPFNTGLHLDLVLPGIEDALLRGRITGTCNPATPALKNGITIFPGGIPLYKNGQFAGAIGISGDGVDQDDLIAAAGTAGFEAPAERRCDQLVIRGVRLPYVKFPRHPNL